MKTETKRMPMLEVSESKFFAILKADRRDIMPSISGKVESGDYKSEWQTNDNNRHMFGESFDDRYFIIARAEAIS